jgi:F-type H+-transporting ATPase subunit beta
MNQGTIVQCIGAVVDVEFARNEMPKIYDALKMDELGLTLEVQQQLGDGVVRLRSAVPTACAADDRRQHRQSDHGAGRWQDARPHHGRVGRPIDERGPVDAEKTMSIHRNAPSFEAFAVAGAARDRHQVIDLCSVRQGRRWPLRRRRAAKRHDDGAHQQQRAHSGRRFRRRGRAHARGNDFYHEMIESGVVDRWTISANKVAMVYGQMNEPPGNRLRVALTGLTIAENFREERPRRCCS